MIRKLNRQIIIGIGNERIGCKISYRTGMNNSNIRSCVKAIAKPGNQLSSERTGYGISVRGIKGCVCYSITEIPEISIPVHRS